MACLQHVSTDIVHLVARLLPTADLVSLSYCLRIPDRAWDAHVARRCGSKWPAGKAGIVRFMQCIYGHTACDMLNRTTLRHDPEAVYVANAMQNQQKIQKARCLATCNMLRQGCVAVGHDYGIDIHSGGDIHSVWIGVQVLAIAFVEPHYVWFCTVRRHLYELSLRTNSKRLIGGHRISAGGQPVANTQNVYDVSGPVGVAGTGTGIWPLQGSRDIACTCVVQSAVCIAGWHVSGEITVFDAKTKKQLYFVDTGESHFVARSLSIIGDVIRVSGRTWCGKRCTGRCTHDTRCVTDDGNSLYTLTPYYMGLTRFPSSHTRDTRAVLS